MYIIIILSLMPLFLWIYMTPLVERFSDIDTITTSIGQILGLLGIMFFSINLILAGKFKFLDRFFKGLDKIYVNHSKIGAIAFSMILFHPLFLVIKYIIFSTKSAALFFVPFVNMSITWGIISLLILIILMVFTYYIKLRYNIWKFSHKFMTLAFLFAVIHIFFINSDVSRNIFLRYYILTFAFLAMFVMVRKFFFDYIFNKKLKYQIIKIKQLNKDIIEIEMKPINKSLLYKEGQFAFFSFMGNVSSESHPFSISSSTNEPYLKITIKNLGDFTSNLSLLKEGGIVYVDGPYGYFSYKNIKNNKQIWIAGGIGITPFFSMAKSLNDNYNVNLFYSVKDENDSVYSEELLKISKINPNFKFNLWNTRERGYIDAKIILKNVVSLDDTDIFFCGPPVFMESLKNQFTQLGVDIKKIHYENFSF